MQNLIALEEEVLLIEEEVVVGGTIILETYLIAISMENLATLQLVNGTYMMKHLILTI